MNNQSNNDLFNTWRDLDRSFDKAISDHVRLADDVDDVYFYIDASGFNTLSWVEGLVLESIRESIVDENS